MRFQTFSIITLAFASSALAAPAVGPYRQGEIQRDITFNRAIKLSPNINRNVLPGIPQPPRGNQITYGRKSRSRPNVVDAPFAQRFINEPRGVEEEMEFERRDWDDSILEARSPAKGGSGGGKSGGGGSGFASKVGKIANKVGRVANAVSAGYKAYKGGKRDMGGMDWDLEARDVDELELEARMFDDEMELEARHNLLEIDGLD